MTANLPARSPRRLPIAPLAPAGGRGATLEAHARPTDIRARPIYAVWELTLACDLACQHCGSRAGRARPDELKTGECLDLVDQLAGLGVLEVTLIGGEAYLRKDWLRVITAIRSRGMRCTMTTGGRGLTHDMIAAARDAGLQGISVSLDGTASAHDAQRGVRGAYASATAALVHARELGLAISCNTQLNRVSTPCLPELLETLGELRVRSWQYQLTVPMGRAADAVELLLQPYDLLELLPLLARLKERARELGVRMWNGNNVGYFGPHEAALRSSATRSHGRSCGAGITTIGIEANGAIKGCPSLSSDAWTGGNVRDHRLVDIWERATSLRYTRDRTVANLWGYCASCYYADECRGGCTWTSDVVLGRPGNNPFCHHRALEFKRMGKRERIELVQSAPGLPFDRGRFELIEEDWPEAEVHSALDVLQRPEARFRHE